MAVKALLVGSVLAHAAEALSPVGAAARGDKKYGAVLVSGMFDRLQVTPLLENVVRANVEAGIQVDIYFSLKPAQEVQNYAANKAESKWLVTEDSATKYTPDMKVIQAKSSGLSEAEMFAKLCKWAEEAGATTCRTEPEKDEALVLPNDDMHQKVMSYYSPLTTDSGGNVLRRWRSIENLWDQAKQSESTNGFTYNSVLVVRDDDYWLSPYIFETADFEARPNTMKSIACLEAHGINDKTLHIGRTAADHVIPAYQAWKDMPSDALKDTRNAEEFLFKLSMVRGVGLRPRGLPVALATTTVSGIPCFRKQSFNLTGRGGYQKCHDEKSENGALTKFFRTFSCDAMSPKFYDVLKPEEVTNLAAAANRAGGDDRAYILFMVATADNAEKVKSTLNSLKSTDKRKALVVARKEGLCAELAADNGECIELAIESTDPLIEHALLTTTLLAGSTKGILYAEPGVQVEAGATQALKDASSGKDVAFTPERKEGETCKDVTDGGDISGRMFLIRDTPGSAHALMRAWMFMTEEALPGGLHQGEAVISGMDWQFSGRPSSLKSGDVGVVRGASKKDPTRVVVDFASVPGLAMLPKYLSLEAPFTSMVARAAQISTGVRVGVAACDQPSYRVSA